ncbi:response regulator [Paenibacillus terrae]|uniref:Response regulator receiver protein n=1 Tax=Paenibacillus terrae TaxID=159743 RepID=A0A0D7WXP2_9BACL|nr:response regulator [Paenibacillus terrae]KJD43961.1 response regulator receiver protein [Paenibacillus terrae]
MGRSDKFTRIILLDDEELALDYMKRLFSKIENIHIVGSFMNPLAAKEHILLENIDVAFLDVSLPEMNGIELAKQIQVEKPRLHIVFVTAYDKYAIQAFEINALDYLIKPVTTDRLIKTLNRILERDGHPALQPSSDPPLRLQVFREVAVELTDQQLTAIQWRTKKSQELFLYLLLHHDQLVRKSALIELLWSEHDEEKAYSLLYTAAYYLRKAMGPYKDYLKIDNTSGGYILNTTNILLDKEEWEYSLTSAPPISQETIDDYTKIMKLYRGDYLQEYDYWWAESERQRLQKMWIATSLKMGEWYNKNAQPDKAISLYEDICNRHPQAEDAYWGLMKIYADMKKDTLVSQWYDLLLSVLWEELHVKPNEQITDWYNRWKMTHV